MNQPTEPDDSNHGCVLAAIVLIAVLSGVTGFAAGLLVGVLRNA